MICPPRSPSQFRLLCNRLANPNSTSHRWPASTREIFLKLAEDDIFHLLDAGFPRRTPASLINRMCERLISALKILLDSLEFITQIGLLKPSILILQEGIVPQSNSRDQSQSQDQSQCRCSHPCLKSLCQHRLKSDTFQVLHISHGENPTYFSSQR